jgi:acyl-CoA synthetase (AMP-forming)/AMP-acid ligase II
LQLPAARRLAEAGSPRAGQRVLERYGRDHEELLGEHPGVAEAAVVGIPSEEWGEQVTAFVVPADPAAPPDPGSCTTWRRCPATPSARS